MGSVPPEPIAAVVRVLDDEDLLRVACCVDTPAALTGVVAGIDDERIRSIVRTGLTSQPEIQVAALGVMGLAEDELKRRLGGLATDLGPEALGGFLRTAVRESAVADLIRLVGAMDKEAMRTVLKLPELEEPEIADAVLEAAHQFDLWPHLARFADVVDGDSASASGPWSSARRGTAGCTTISVRCGRGWRNSLVACAHERSRRSTR